MLDIKFFPNSKESCDVDFAKNLIKLLNGQKISYSKDSVIVEKLISVKDNLIEIKNNSQNFNLTIYKPDADLYSMPKLSKDQTEELLEFYIDKLSMILQNKD